MKPVIQNVKISQLLLNIENPRFEMGSNQRDVIQKMIDDQGDKMFQLAKHISLHGLNPGEVAYVTPSEREPGRYEVLEGNRRITALKILANPALIDGQYKALSDKIKKLTDDFKKRNLKEVLCVIYNDPKDAQKWIKLKHTGQNNGVGVVEWDTHQQARYDAKVEGKAPAVAIQVIDFLKKSSSFPEALKPKLQEVKATSLGRLLGDPHFRDFLGFTQDDGILESRVPETEVVKGLTKVVTDLLSPDFTVNNIYYKEDRKDYIETFGKNEIPDTSKATSPWALTASKSSQKTNIPVPVPAQKKKSNHLSTSRKFLIPTSFIVNIKDKRVNKIYRELKSLELSEFENAVSVLFRVLIELSIDNFIHEKKIKTIASDKELYKKVQAVADYFELTEKTLTKQQLKAVRTAATNANSIISINTFNAYVHNPHYHPQEKDLKTTWDNLQTFIEKVLEAI